MKRRLSIVRNSAKLFVMHEGLLVLQGTYDELLRCAAA